MSVPARVMFVAPSAYPLGGVQSWLDYLLPSLRHHDWEPVLGLVTGRWHDVDRYLVVHPGHEHVVIANPTGSREGRVQALIRAVRQVNPDLLVAVNICDCYAAIERMRAMGKATPHVAMADHSLDPDYLYDARNWAHVIDGFVATNRLTERLALDFAGLEQQRIHYAPYGVTTTGDFTAGTRLVDGSLRIAYAGRFDEQQKRAQDIPAILAELEQAGVNYQCRLAGGGPYLGALQNSLQRQIESGAVQFLGVLDADALCADLYDWANALLVTSSWETGPIVIWEAMARGLPVVSSRYVGAGLENGLKDGVNCLLFNPGDVGTAASQLRRLIDIGLGISLAKTGLALVESRYSQAQSVSTWDACLKRIVESPQIRSIPQVTTSPPSGRLDRWLGPTRGERLRRLLRLVHQHVTSGGEWPHTYHTLIADEEKEYWSVARELDMRPA